MKGIQSTNPREVTVSAGLKVGQEKAKKAQIIPERMIVTVAMKVTWRSTERHTVTVSMLKTIRGITRI